MTSLVNFAYTEKVHELKLNFTAKEKRDSLFVKQVCIQGGEKEVQKYKFDTETEARNHLQEIPTQKIWTPLLHKSIQKRFTKQKRLEYVQNAVTVHMLCFKSSLSITDFVKKPQTNPPTKLIIEGDSRAADYATAQVITDFTQRNPDSSVLLIDRPPLSTPLISQGSVVSQTELHQINQSENNIYTLLLGVKESIAESDIQVTSELRDTLIVIPPKLSLDSEFIQTAIDKQDISVLIRSHSEPPVIDGQVWLFNGENTGQAKKYKYLKQYNGEKTTETLQISFPVYALETTQEPYLKTVLDRIV